MVVYLPISLFVKVSGLHLRIMTRPYTNSWPEDGVVSIYFHLNNLQYLIPINHYSTVYCLWIFIWGLSVRRLIRKCSLITNKQYIILKYRIFHIYTSLIRLPRVWRRGMHEGIPNWFVYPNGYGIGPTRPQNSQILCEVFQMLGPITGNLKSCLFSRRAVHCLSLGLASEVIGTFSIG